MNVCFLNSPNVSNNYPWTGAVRLVPKLVGSRKLAPNVVPIARPEGSTFNHMPATQHNRSTKSWSFSIFFSYFGTVDKDGGYVSFWYRESECESSRTSTNLSS